MERKTFNIYMMLLMAAAILTSCSGDNLEAEFVSSDRLASGTRIDVSGEASTGNVIPVEANCAWTVTTDVNWITITQPSAGRGNGSQSVVFDVAASTSPTSQTGTITIKTGDGIERIITVNQRPGTIVVIPSPTSMFFTCEGGTQTLDVTSNTQWTATSSVDWLTINDAKSFEGTENQTLTIRAQQNGNSDAVIGAITLTDADRKAAPVTIYVEVGGKNPVLVITPANEVGAEGGIATFGILSNFYWRAVVTNLSPEGDWNWTYFTSNNQLALDGNPSSVPVDVTMNIDPNPSLQERTINITVWTNSSFGDNVNKNLVIRQRAATLPVVYLPRTTNVAMNEATLTFSATSTTLPITECGLLYSNDPEVTQGSRIVGTLTGEEATATLPGLQSGTTYYVRAYAKNAAGIGYSETMSFKTRLTPGRDDNETP